MQISVDVGASELVKWARSIAKSKSQALAVRSRERAGDWAERKIIEQIIKTRKGELRIANPAIHGISWSVLKSLSLNVHGARAVASCWFNSFAAIETRSRRIAKAIGRISLVRKAITAFVDGSANCKGVLAFGTGDICGEAGLKMSACVDEHTKVLRDHGWSAVAALSLTGERSLLESATWISECQKQRTRSKDSIASYDICERATITQLFLIEDELILVTRDDSSNEYLIMDKSVHKRPYIPCDKDRSLMEEISKLRNDENTSISADDVITFQQGMLKAIGENRTTQAGLFYLRVVSYIMVMDNRPGPYSDRLTETLNQVLDDLRCARHLQHMVESVCTGSEFEENISLSISDLKDITGVQPSSSWKARLLRVDELPDEKSTDAFRNEMLDPNFRNADKVLEAAFQSKYEQTKRTRRYSEQCDLNEIRFSSIIEGCKNVQSTSGIDVKLKRSKLNRFTGEQSSLYYTPYSSHALFFCWHIDITGLGRGKLQRYTSYAMMPYVVPAVLTSSLGLMQRAYVVDKIKAAFQKGKSIMNLGQVLQADIRNCIVERANSESGLALSHLLCGFVYDALSPEEKAWVHREVVEELVSMGARNSGKVTGCSCYFDTVRGLFQVKQADLPVTIDLMTPLSNVSIFGIRGHLFLLPANSEGKVAKVVFQSNNLGLSTMESSRKIVHISIDDEIEHDLDVEILDNVVETNVWAAGVSSESQNRS